jgi:hypothetical protein
LRDAVFHKGWKQPRFAIEIAVYQAFRTARASRDFTGCGGLVAFAGK